MVSKSRDARQKAKAEAAVPVKAPITKKIGGEKNGGERTIYPKTPAYYPTDDVSKPVPSRKNANRKPTKLRQSITPGTILILLAGRHRGRRVVFLKQMPSGLLLVTGPFKFNGVPMKRVDQAYVIATSTTVDVAGVDVSQYDDAFFAGMGSNDDEAAEGAEAGEGGEGDEAKKHTPVAARVEAQKTVDASLVAAISADAELKAYLRSSFTLSKGQFPHEMKF